MNINERFTYTLKRRYPDLSDVQVAALIKTGLTSPLLVNAASDETLLAVKGIGAATLEKIRKQVGK